MEQARPTANQNPPPAADAAESLVDFLMALPAEKKPQRRKDAETERLEMQLARRMRAEIGARLRDDAA